MTNKSASELLREWAAIVEADPLKQMGDIGRTSPHRGDPVISPDLGAGAGPSGAGRGTNILPFGRGKPAAKPAPRVEPKLEPGAKPKIQRQPGETPAQAVQRAKKDLELKPEPVKPAVKADRRGRVEPKLEPLGKMKAGKRAPAPPPESPIPHKKKAAAAAAAAAGLYFLNKDDEDKPKGTTVEPGANWGGDEDYKDERTTGTVGGAAASQGQPGGQLGGQGSEVAADTRPGQGPVTPADSADRSGDATSSVQVDVRGGQPGVNTGVDNDSFYWSRRMQNIKESNYNVYTKHPVTGEIVRIKLQQPVMENIDNKFYSGYTCGSVRQVTNNSWKTNVWSTSPVAKLLKGKQQ